MSGKNFDFAGIPRVHRGSTVGHGHRTMYRTSARLAAQKKGTAGEERESTTAPLAGQLGSLTSSSSSSLSASREREKENIKGQGGGATEETNARKSGVGEEKDKAGSNRRLLSLSLRSRKQTNPVPPLDSSVTNTAPLSQIISEENEAHNEDRDKKPTKKEREKPPAKGRAKPPTAPTHMPPPPSHTLQDPHHEKPSLPQPTSSSSSTASDKPGGTPFHLPPAAGSARERGDKKNAPLPPALPSGSSSKARPSSKAEREEKNEQKELPLQPQSQSRPPFRPLQPDPTAATAGTQGSTAAAVTEEEGNCEEFEASSCISAPVSLRRPEELEADKTPELVDTISVQRGGKREDMALTATEPTPPLSNNRSERKREGGADSREEETHTEKPPSEVAPTEPPSPPVVSPDAGGLLPTVRNQGRQRSPSDRSTPSTIALLATGVAGVVEGGGETETVRNGGEEGITPVRQCQIMQERGKEGNGGAEAMQLERPSDSASAFQAFPLSPGVLARRKPCESLSGGGDVNRNRVGVGRDRLSKKESRDQERSVSVSASASAKAVDGGAVSAAASLCPLLDSLLSSATLVKAALEVEAKKEKEKETKASSSSASGVSQALPMASSEVETAKQLREAVRAFLDARRGNGGGGHQRGTEGGSSARVEAARKAALEIVRATLAEDKEREARGVVQTRTKTKTEASPQSPPREGPNAAGRHSTSLSLSLSSSTSLTLPGPPDVPAPVRVPPESQTRGKCLREGGVSRDQDGGGRERDSRPPRQCISSSSSSSSAALSSSRQSAAAGGGGGAAGGSHRHSMQMGVRGREEKPEEKAVGDSHRGYRLLGGVGVSAGRASVSVSSSKASALSPLPPSSPSTVGKNAGGTMGQGKESTNSPVGLSGGGTLSPTPTATDTETERESPADVVSECPICCQPMRPGSLIARLKPCGHVLCPECVVKERERQTEAANGTEEEEDGQDGVGVSSSFVFHCCFDRREVEEVEEFRFS
uniref:RING-type domain-containing protein n=1 Tax=Chromera velia CCMP2878 TaxID=1169474 RepID=A0A0G4FHF2_9ALVE|eukprot:Cvel_17024.t1-p1 / transcript=Cvel_17024.t1 / gene=Cvel_17024 / organism=Chromera_velia_CCMP2878 / gene_product=hypothetical protein / transcript_product=hypothetical protein / location=Cvel_scaffold1339:6514-11204(+) / protein_length=992 / sequence_SO=supercontig / SO=protein_coding / is_pseudo=false